MTFASVRTQEEFTQLLDYLQDAVIEWRVSSKAYGRADAALEAINWLIDKNVRLATVKDFLENGRRQ